MKKYILTLMLFLSGTLLFAQHKEWQNLTNLLNKEAKYFSGKSGFIQLTTSTYNTFHIDNFILNDSVFSSAMWLKDRFENQPFEQYIKETVLIYYAPRIKSVELFYDCPYYFENFPNEQFMLIEFEENWDHHIESVSKEIAKGVENKTLVEDTTTQIMLPVRSKNRNKIFKAIDKYQFATYKEEMEMDRNH